MLVERSLVFLWGRLSGRTWTFFLPVVLTLFAQFLVLHFRLLPCFCISVLTLFRCHYCSFFCMICTALHFAFSLLLLLNFCISNFKLFGNALFKLTIYQKQPLHLYEVRVRLAYTLPSPNPTLSDYTSYVIVVV